MPFGEKRSDPCTQKGEIWIFQGDKLHKPQPPGVVFQNNSANRAPAARPAYMKHENTPYNPPGGLNVEHSDKA